MLISTHDTALRMLYIPSLSPFPLYRGGGKGTERLGDLPRGAQQRLGRAGFRLGQLGSESECSTTGLTVVGRCSGICVVGST